MKSKGFVITFIVLLLLLSVFSLNSAIKKNNKVLVEDKRFTSSFERVAYKYENIHDNILDIIKFVGHYSIDINGSRVSITEQLPEKQARDSYEVAITTYVDFVKEHKDGLDLNINSDTIDLSTITIEPFDINYSHADAPGRGNRQNNTIYYYPEELNFEGYFIEVELSNQTFEAVEEDIYFDPASGIDLNIVVLNSSKIEETSLVYGDINALTTSTIILTTSGTANKDIEITISPVGVLTVLNNNAVAVNIVTGVDFGAESSVTPYISFPKGLIQVGEGNLRTEKS